LIASNVSVAIAANYWFLLVGRMVLGVSLGGFWAMAAATAMRLVPAESVPRALAIIFGGSSFASVFAAPASSYLGAIVGWRNVFWLSAGLSVLAFTTQFLTLPKLAPIGDTRLGTIGVVLRTPRFLLGMTAVALAFGGHFAGFTYVRPFLETTTGLGANELSAVLMAFGIADFVATLFAGRVGPSRVRRVLSTLALVMGASCLGLTWFGHSVPETTLLLSVWGAVIGPTAVIWSGWVMRRAPAHAETAGGIYVATIQLAAGLGALVGGPIYDASGSRGIFILCALAWTSAAAVTVRAVRDHRSPVIVTRRDGPSS